MKPAGNDGGREETDLTLEGAGEAHVQTGATVEAFGPEAPSRLPLLFCVTMFPRGRSSYSHISPVGSNMRQGRARGRLPTGWITRKCEPTTWRRSPCICSLLLSITAFDMSGHIMPPAYARLTSTRIRPRRIIRCISSVTGSSTMGSLGPLLPR